MSSSSVGLQYFSTFVVRVFVACWRREFGSVFFVEFEIFTLFVLLVGTCSELGRTERYPFGKCSSNHPVCVGHEIRAGCVVCCVPCIAVKRAR